VSRVRIALRDLSKTFVQGPREIPAVSAVSFDVHDREFVAVVGPSGCGKSTILNMIGSLIAPTSGEILVDGTRVGARPAPQIGYVFQKDTVFPWRTVERNIALGLEYRGVGRAEVGRA
jgi:NitT/TauT family transport system ATP-binding protein